MTTSERAAPDFAGIQALLAREPGYAVAQKCLEVQAAAEAADPTLRTDRGVRLAPSAWSWYVGALGEIEVGALLAQLGPDWFVRHAVPIGAGTTDVDHLLVGPGGVFALNTKRHAGADVWAGDHVLRVNGDNTRHLTASRHEARDVARRLTVQAGFPVPVHAVVVIVGARRVRDGATSALGRGVHVLPSTSLLGWLRARPVVLTPAKLGLIRLASEEPGTWHVDPHAAETLRVMPRFQRLRGEVGDEPPSPHGAAPGSRAPQRAGSARPARRTHSRRPSVRPVSPRPSRPRSTLGTALVASALGIAIPIVGLELLGFLLAAIAPSMH
jgi:hypothetical protein